MYISVFACSLIVIVMIVCCLRGEINFFICDDPFCACGSKQTMLHIVNEWPLTRFLGGLMHFMLQKTIRSLGFAS